MEETDTAPVSPLDLELETQNKLAKGNEAIKKELKKQKNDLLLEKARYSINFAPEKDLRIKELDESLKSDIYDVPATLFSDPMNEMPGSETSTLNLNQKEQLLHLYKNTQARFGSSFAPPIIGNNIELLEKEIEQQKATSPDPKAKNLTDKKDTPPNQNPLYSQNNLHDQTDRQLYSENAISKGIEEERKRIKEQLEQTVERLKNESYQQGMLFPPEASIRIIQINQALKTEIDGYAIELLKDPSEISPRKGSQKLSLFLKKELLSLYKKKPVSNDPIESADHKINIDILTKQISLQEQDKMDEYHHPSELDLLSARLELIQAMINQQSQPRFLRKPYIPPELSHAYEITQQQIDKLKK